MTMVRGSVAKKVVPYLIVAQDGSGDFTDIQTAIDALPSTGGEVFVKEGTYNIDTEITIPNDDITIRGAGFSTNINGTANIDIFSVSAKTRVTFDRLRFTDSSNTITAIDISGASSFCKIFNCIFSSMFARAINIAGTDHLVQDNVCDSSGTHGISISGSRNRILNNISTGAANGNGILVAGDSTFSIIRGNIFTSNSLNGILLGAGSDNSIVEGNVCSSNNSGISATDFTSCIICNNVCSSNTNRGIYIATGATDGGRNSVISNNVCMDNTNEGIYFLDADNCIASGNRCGDNGQEFRISTANDCIIIGNNLIGTGISLIDIGTNTIHLGNKLNGKDNI